QQLGPRLPVPVLPRQRAAVRDDQVGQFLGEAAEAGDPGPGQQVEVDTDVDAAVPEVPVGGAAQAVGGEQPTEVPQVGAEAGGRHRAVLPAGPRLRAVRHPGRGAAGVLADPPQGALPGRVGDDDRVDGVGRADHRLGPRAGSAAAPPPAPVPRPVPTNSQAPPRGRSTADGTRSAAMPSTVSGPHGSSPAAASAAALSSAYPRTARARARGAGTRSTTASVRMPSVPSEPQNERATSAPFSGSRASRA